MGTARLLARVESTVQEVLAARVPPEDEVEWEVSLVPTVSECEEHGGSISLALGFHASLLCPETSKRVVATVVIPLSECDDEDLAESIHSIWDGMAVSRMAEATNTGS